MRLDACPAGKYGKVMQFVKSITQLSYQQIYR